jgi:HAD superfamily hydrolase (TIGR01509 family)
MLKGIIFDMDGTITLTEGLHHKAFATIFREHGIEYPLDDHLARFAGAGSKAIFSKIFEEHGRKLNDAEIEDFVAQKRNLYTKFVQETEMETVHGVKEFVQMIHAKGLKKIIATGNSNLDIVHFILEKVGLLVYFPDIVSITEVPHGKPFPDVFLEAASRIECLPGECVVLEDAVNGVESAKAAGIRCIAFETTTRREDLLKAGAQVVLKDYTQLTDEILNSKF